MEAQRSRRQDPLARLYRYVEYDPFGGCWLWSGAIFANSGYGHFRLDGKGTTTSRAAWRLLRGEIPTGLFVLHKCDNRLCCNPDHLFLGTHQENMSDMCAKGRAIGPRGQAHPKARLTPDAVRQIRLRLDRGESQHSLADFFGVHRATIQSIHERRNWAWLDASPERELA